MYFLKSAAFRRTIAVALLSAVAIASLIILRKINAEVKAPLTDNISSIQVDNYPVTTSESTETSEVKETVSENVSSTPVKKQPVAIPKIAEVIAYSAETFNGNSRDNMTRPTNSYLPEGTVDYVTDSFSANGCTYLKLRCGKRIYTKRLALPGNTYLPVSRVYEGTLPDHNEISVSSVIQDERCTEITLDTLFKAPFFLNLLPQKYTNPTIQDYTVKSVTMKYVEINFCYATVFNGSIAFSADNPLFSSAEIVNGGSQQTLRLYLKKAGAFYGWDAFYNSAGQLVFRFNHPIRSTAADNEYGTDLTGIRILVDAGHGGSDSGAIGISGINEADSNLRLAIKIGNRLKSLGATVYMTRTKNIAIDSEKRILLYRKYRPDILVSVHHDSSDAPDSNGFGAYYGNPFSMPLAKAVYNRALETGIYSNPGESRTLLGWHYFYMTRMTFCPSVLTENGYVSSPADQEGITKNEYLDKKAIAVVQGICDYFNSIP